MGVGGGGGEGQTECIMGNWRIENDFLVLFHLKKVVRLGILVEEEGGSKSLRGNSLSECLNLCRSV